MYVKIVRRGEFEWVNCEDNRESEELWHDDDLLAEIFRTPSSDPGRAYRWVAWASDERISPGYGYAETPALAKEYAERWLWNEGEL